MSRTTTKKNSTFTGKYFAVASGTNRPFYQHGADALYRLRYIVSGRTLLRAAIAIEVNDIKRPSERHHIVRIEEE